MNFQAPYSSSAGNLYIVKANNGKRILIDPGVPPKKLTEAIGYNMDGLEAAFASHAHQDHCCAVPYLLGMGVDVYAGQETFDKVAPGPLTHHMHVLQDGVSVKTNSFTVMPFECVHNVPCFGFIVKEIATGEYLLFATDTARITQEFYHIDEKRRCRIPFSIVAVGCNYDADRLDTIVEQDKIHEALAIRLLGSHSSKQGLKAYLMEHCDLSRCRGIHLLHMSNSNIDQEATRKEFEEMFLITTRIGYLV